MADRHVVHADEGSQLRPESAPLDEGTWERRRTVEEDDRDACGGGRFDDAEDGRRV